MYSCMRSLKETEPGSKLRPGRQGEPDSTRKLREHKLRFFRLSLLLKVNTTHLQAVLTLLKPFIVYESLLLAGVLSVPPFFPAAQTSAEIDTILSFKLGVSRDVVLKTTNICTKVK